ncbi:hypothetical protein EVA_09413, partial [gut metagenome]
PPGVWAGEVHEMVAPVTFKTIPAEVNIIFWIRAKEIA